MHSGKDLGTVIGGDIALQHALSRLSTLYWAEQNKYEEVFARNKRVIPPNAVNSDVKLTLIGNGAVCSAYSVRFFFIAAYNQIKGRRRSLLDGLIVKRIHPYLHSHTQSKPYTSLLREINWEKACETDDYLKSFFFDFLVCYNLRHASFVQQYAVQEGSLQLTAPEASAEEKTYYLFAEKLDCSLDHYLKRLNSPCGLGYYDALLVLLRLSLVLEHCFAYQIVHNDLKPDNIMLRNNNIADICLIDFGESFLGFDVVSDSPVVTKGNQHFK